VGFPGNRVGESAGFLTQGLILAGGFVRHPVIWAVRMAGRVSSAMPMWCVKLFCEIYARYAKFRHKRAPETLATIAEFVANRTMEADRRAIVHRYTLIAENDLRPVARHTDFPVYYLAGLVDPLVPWCYVRWWLRRHCPGYRGGRTMWRADHNVLGTAPQKSAVQIHNWIANASLPQPDIELTDDPSRKAANRCS
jgi:pimeloyl-ACP methyl ester carboxylesterase